MKKTLFAATAALALALSGCAGSTPESPAPLEKIVLAGLPMDENPDASVRYQLMMDLISEATGLPVEFYEAPDYASIVEGLVAGRAQFAQLDGLTYVSASNLSEDVDLLLAYTRNKDERPGLYSYGVTRIDSGIDSLEDLAGKTVCFPDPSSSSGYLWPAFALTQAGFNPDPVATEDFIPRIAGNFPATWQGVYNGDCDAGFIADVSFNKLMQADETIKPEELVKFWESDTIPSGAFAVNSAAVPADIVAQVKAVLLEKANKDYFVEAGLCEDIATCPHLAVSVWGYVESNDEFFDPVRDVCNTLGLEQCAKKD